MGWTLLVGHMTPEDVRILIPAVIVLLVIAIIWANLPFKKKN